MKKNVKEELNKLRDEINYINKDIGKVTTQLYDCLISVIQLNELIIACEGDYKKIYDKHPCDE